MPERSSKSQQIHVGRETAYGVSATVNRRLQGVTIDLDPTFEKSPNLPQGYNFPTSNTLGKEYTEGSIGGSVTYDEVIIPLAMALGNVAPTQPDAAGAPTAYQRVYTLPNTGDITPTSFTLQKGDTSAAEGSTGVIATGLEFSWDRENVEISGDVIGQAFAETVTLTTAGVTALPQVPVQPGHIGAFYDTAFASLGTTRLLRAFSGGFSLTDLFSMIWPLNETKTSYDGIVSAAPDAEVTATLMADAAGKQFVTRCRAGEVGFLRWRALGPVIGGTVRYLLQFDLAVEVLDVDEFGDEDGIYAIPFTYQPMAHEGWGQAGLITVINTQSGTAI